MRSKFNTQYHLALEHYHKYLLKTEYHQGCPITKIMVTIANNKNIKIEIKVLINKTKKNWFSAHDNTNAEHVSLAWVDHTRLFYIDFRGVGGVVRGHIIAFYCCLFRHISWKECANYEVICFYLQDEIECRATHLLSCWLIIYLSIISTNHQFSGERQSINASSISNNDDDNDDSNNYYR